VPEAQRFGRYRVTATLGAGAMGEVFAAVDDVLGREVAVKTLKGHHNGLAARMLDQRFRQEARAVASLAHPSIVQVFDIDLAAEPPYLVMERVAGPSLKERLEAGALPLADVRALGIQIGRALAAAHAQKVIHRDVKPANILGAGAGAWKLADFGVAHVPDSSLTMTGQFVGSPAYAPPEALVKGQSDAEGDIYGLGATLYQAAAGRWPRLEDKSSALIPTVPPLAQLAPHLPPELCALIDRAISLDAAQRPTAAQLADALANGAHASQASPPLAADASVAAAAVAPPPLAAHASMPLAAGATTPPLGASSTTSVGVVSLSSTSSGVSDERPAWKRYAILAAIVVVLIAIVAASQGGAGSSSPASLGAPVPYGAPSADLDNGAQRFDPPEMTDEHQIKDWNKIVDQLDKGHYDDAKRKLDEWEHDYGENETTKALHRTLDALPDRGPRKRGKGRGHGPRDDD
jgi:serine/threonine protein kinase